EIRHPELRYTIDTLSALVPTALFRSDYLFLTPEFQHTYARVIAKLAEAVTIDGVDVGALVPIGGSGFGWAIVPLAPGPHRARADEPFGLMIFGNQDAGYVPGGLPSAFEMPGGLDVRTVAID
ncbi:MAG: hypothetical protein AABZ30_01470, partial [Myxococcota bacterium]